LVAGVCGNRVSDGCAPRARNMLPDLSFYGDSPTIVVWQSGQAEE
jgi:hypothetical protein